MVVVLATTLPIHYKQISADVGYGGSQIFFTIIFSCKFIFVSSQHFFCICCHESSFEENYNRNRKDTNRAHDVIVYEGFVIVEYKMNTTRYVLTCATWIIGSFAGFKRLLHMWTRK